MEQAYYYESSFTTLEPRRRPARLCILDPSVVNAQKLVCGSGHVHEIRFALGTLFIQKLIHRLVGGRAL